MRQFLEALVELIEPNNCCFVQQTQTHSRNVIDFSNAIERYSIGSLLSNENHQAEKKKIAIFNPSKELSFSNDSRFLTNIIERISQNITLDGLLIIGCETGGISREAKALLSNLGWYVKSFVPVEQKYFCEFAPVWVILSRQENTNLLFLPSDNYLKEVPQKCAELLLNGDVQLWTQHNCVSARNDFRGYAVENCRNNIKAILENSDGFQLVKLGKILQPFTKDRGRNETDSIFSIEKFLSHDYRKLGPDFYENYNLDPSFNINDPLKNNTLEFLVKNDTIAKYLQYIFNTELGKWILGASGVHLHDIMDSANNFVFKVELDSLLIEKIPLPDETKMKEMLSTHKNLSKLKFHSSRL